MKTCIVAFILIVFGGSPFLLNAQAGMSHFGGEITNVQYCTCPADLAVMFTVKDLRTNSLKTLKYSVWYSRLNLNYNIFTTGVKVMGGSVSGNTACLVYAGYSCSSNGNAGAVVDFIRGVGTTLK